MPPSIDELELLSSPLFIKWLLGQSIAFVTVVICLGAWNRSLTKQLRESREEARLERERSNELSNCLIQNTEGHLRQRAKDIDDFALRSDSSVRSLLMFFEGLSSRHNITEISTAKRRVPDPALKRLTEDDDPTPMPRA